MKNFSNEEEMIKYLSSKYHIIKKDEKIEEKLHSEIDAFSKESKKNLIRENPFYENQKAFKLAQEDLLKSGGLDIESDLKYYNKLMKISDIKIDNNYWNSQIYSLKEKDKKNATKTGVADSLKKIAEDAKITRKLLQEKWKKALDEAYAKWELQQLQKYREEFMKKIEEWLELLQLMDDTLSSLSLDTGALCDLSKGTISLQDINEIKKWAEYISKNNGVKELLDMLGRLRQAEKTSKKELVKTISHIKEPVVDINSKEEIVGIKIGKDLEHVLPQELALLSDEETSLLFDLKYVEGRLMSFDLHGLNESIKEIEEEKLVKVSEEEQKGPIIICVDTSGSMQGSPETIAKAITLYMATKAISDKRDCYLINFSTAIETMDLSGMMGMEKVIKFLRKSFNGGTNASPALSHAVDMMKTQKYKRADVLMISDFVMGSLNDELVKKITLAKENKNRFYSLAIGNLFLHKRLKDVFNHECVYNPQNSSIESIISNLKNLHEK